MKISRLWADKCENGEKNFNEVPSKLKEEVRGMIEEDGYEILEDGTVVKAEKPSETDTEK